jgi:hypothetical protein
MKFLARICALCVLPLALMNVASAYQFVWTNTYDGTGHGSDYIKAMVLDTAGNAYVTGSSFNGVNYDWVTIKYSPEGSPLWTRSYDGAPQLNDYAVSLAVDNSGNVYVTGSSALNGSQTAIVVVKYSNLGDFQWASPVSFSAAIDTPSKIGLSAAGDPYVCGSTGNSQAFVLKLSGANGGQLWHKLYNFGLHGDALMDMVVDASGHSYACGYSNDSSGHPRALILKHDATGTLVYKYFYASTGANALLQSIAIDSSYGVAATGIAKGANAFDVLTVKLNRSGSLSWKQLFDDANHLDDNGNCVAIDSDHSVYIGGSIETPAVGSDFLTMKYSPEGNLNFAITKDFAAHSDDQVNAISVDVYHRIHAVGFGRLFPHPSLVGEVYDGDFGTPVDEFIYNSNSDVTGRAVSVDSKGHAWYAGTLSDNYIVVKTKEAPVAQDDLYSVNYGHALSVATKNGVLSSNDRYSGTAALLTSPTHGTLTLDGTGAFTYTPNAGFYGTDQFTYQNYRDGMSSNATVTLPVVPALASLTVTPTSVTGGTNATGIAKINYPAPSYGQSLFISSSNPAVASVPSSVTVLAGKLEVSFPITTQSVVSATTVTITAKWNGNVKTATLTVNP